MWTNVTEEMLLSDSGHKNSLNRSAIKRNSLRISLFFYANGDDIGEGFVTGWNWEISIQTEGSVHHQQG
jgi:hypothetical protein